MPSRSPRSSPLPALPPRLLRRTAVALHRLVRSARRPPRGERDLADCRRQRDRWRHHADCYERELTRVRNERAHLLAWLAALHPASAVLLAPDPEAGPDGGHRLCVEAGGRRMSWHLRPADLPLFTHTRHAPAGVPAPAHQLLEQAAHLRRHTRLLALEGLLSAESAPASPPGDAEGSPGPAPRTP
ncbi:hypothetical protein ACIPSE_09840 [Streptomyces sp. NPDC090106]|uniref:hypothetical protein n=1 Tax=Streptomyces sp. NPDC090106 TaxID=3365946 RepID=UPI003819A772